MRWMWQSSASGVDLGGEMRDLLKRRVQRGDYGMIEEWQRWWVHSELRNCETVSRRADCAGDWD